MNKKLKFEKLKVRATPISFGVNLLRTVAEYVKFFNETTFSVIYRKINIYTLHVSITNYETPFEMVYENARAAKCDEICLQRFRRRLLLSNFVTDCVFHVLLSNLFDLLFKSYRNGFRIVWFIFIIYIFATWILRISLNALNNKMFHQVPTVRAINIINTVHCIKSSKSCTQNVTS